MDFAQESVGLRLAINGQRIVNRCRLNCQLETVIDYLKVVDIELSLVVTSELWAVTFCTLCACYLAPAIKSKMLLVKLPEWAFEWMSCGR